MNKGKICVSVCAGGLDEFINGIRNAAELADIIELRFDCLTMRDIEKLLKRLPGLKIPKTLLATFRSKEQGGRRNVGIEERQEFWKNVPNLFWAGDLEEDALIFSSELTRKIVSFHDFEGVPYDLETIYNRLASTGADIVKIAVQVEDVTETIGVWKILERAKAEKRQIVPIAMGEAGKSTRILGLARGSAVTYALPDGGKGTAPGQMTARELVDVYRAKELDEKTEVYGVIGGNTAYSISPHIHNSAFSAKGLNSVFLPLQVRDIDAFIRRMVRPETREVDLNFRGFAITIPHKQAIIKLLDEVDEVACRIGAVNTVKIEDGHLYGFNTDADGFIEPLKTVYGDLTDARVAVVGAGGAARACVYALVGHMADVMVFARNPDKAREIAEEFGAGSGLNPISGFSGFDIVINATPLGTSGDLANETIATSDSLKGVKLVYDLIYNPADTQLLREATAAGVETIGGLEMLIGQGARQFEIWTGLTTPLNEMRRAASARLS